MRSAMKPLEFLTLQDENQHLQLRLIGNIDENVTYPSFDFSLYKELTLDLSGIDLINSTGIQSWIIFFKSIPESININFDKCNIRVINQINQFPGFLDGRKINYKSFFAPYFCEDCDRSIDSLIVVEEHKEDLFNTVAPQFNCSCNQPLEFDSLEKKYFKFLEEYKVA